MKPATVGLLGLFKWDQISIRRSVKWAPVKIQAENVAGPSGPQLDKNAGPTAILRASGPRARSILRPDYL